MTAQIIRFDAFRRPRSAKASSIAQKKYRNSGLAPELSDYLIKELRELMESDALYLDANLTQPMLAERLGVPVNYLSQTINEQTGDNFHAFLHAYRIRAASEQLISKPGKTVLDIALDCGYNSKSAFYTAFQRQTGMSPLAYRRQDDAPSHVTERLRQM